VNNLTEQGQPPLTNRDLSGTGMTRETAYIWKNDRGQRFRFIPRARVRRMTTEDRAQAVVVLRFRPGYHPTTVEGAVVRSLLLDERVMYLNALLPRLQAWYAEDAWEFFLRAVADKRAFVSVLVRLDER
jgi:hypothetical protein